MSFTIQGNIIDIFSRRIFKGIVNIENGVITDISPSEDVPDQYILPGFVDAHIHIESSMLVPSEFARLASVHGTVATISDPHEIANVNGIEGIEYMQKNAATVPFKFFFGAPSCVPATGFETASAEINSEEIAQLMQRPDIWYLSEMMNYPGVLYEDKEVHAKVKAAHAANKPVDGHAPGLRGSDAAKYASYGISTDHECFTLEEALDKVAAGMHILIREGSAAKNFEALHPLLKLHPDKVMFCSDDKHPDELILHHINNHVKRALSSGYELFDVLRAACVNPVLHYKVPVGLLRKNDPADFIVVDNLKDFNVLQTYVNGIKIAEQGKSLIETKQAEVINNFKAEKKPVEAFHIKAETSSGKIRVIEAIEGQLITNEILADKTVDEYGYLVNNAEEDVLKVCVVNRYQKDAPVASAFIKGFGIKKGALASTVAHDCHNIIAVGVSDEAICEAVNAIVECKGGIAVTDGQKTEVLPLAVAGLMSNESGEIVSEKYSYLDKKAKELGSSLHAPFMTLSFMALLVIPSLKLSDKGLFDGKNFSFTAVEV
jgi:adenine deaminase